MLLMRECKELDQKQKIVKAVCDNYEKATLQKICSFLFSPLNRQEATAADNKEATGSQTRLLPTKLHAYFLRPEMDRRTSTFTAPPSPRCVRLVADTLRGAMGLSTSAEEIKFLIRDALSARPLAENHNALLKNRLAALLEKSSGARVNVASPPNKKEDFWMSHQNKRAVGATPYDYSSLVIKYVSNASLVLLSNLRSKNTFTSPPLLP